VNKKIILKTITKPALNRAVIVLLLGTIVFICGCPYHRMEVKPGEDINKEEEEKHEHIPDTTDPVLLNRF
jgi:hypothetical protein